MRYSKEHKERTHRLIVEAASAQFRKHGVEGVAVAELMGHAGLTHGGFYAHFKSKEDLFRESVHCALDVTTGKFRQAVRHADDGLEVIVRGYLNRTHRDEPQQGCVGASLTPEIARHPMRTRRVFAKRITQLVSLIEDQLTGSPADARPRSIAIFALMMGALQLARVEPDKDHSQQILEGAIEAALVLGGRQVG